jgi:hypothetical protein
MKPFSNDKCYTQHGAIFVPSIEIVEYQPTYRYEPLRGYGYIMAAISDSSCIGWVDCVKMGYPTVNEYMAANSIPMPESSDED